MLYDRSKYSVTWARFHQNSTEAKVEDKGYNNLGYIQLTSYNH